MTQERAFRVLPQRSKLLGGLRLLRMKLGHLVRGTAEPAPVGRPDYYTRELDSFLFIRDAGGLGVRSFLESGHREEGPLVVARACHDRYGVYPLNFSFPTPHATKVSFDKRPNFLSTTYPGEPHSFTQWGDYLQEYRSSYYALSTRKGGWDTFRHLEILFQATIPLMPGLEDAHPYALAHYPKRALTTILASLIDEGPALPDEATQEFLVSWAHRHLTTRAMAEYLMEVSALSTERVVFLDSTLPSRTDYLSAFTLIGLSEVLGKKCVSAFEPAYLFDDFSGDTSRFYGKGFGYSQVIPASVRSNESLPVGAPLSDLVSLTQTASAIVVGNYDSNREAVGDLLKAGISPEKFVCVLGSDLPPDRSLLRDIRRSGMTFFVREFAA